MTETDTSLASVHHWDEFWRAREKAVQQEDIGSRDPAPAEYWDTFFRKEFASVRQPRLLDVACGVGAVTAIALRAAEATTADVAAYCADYSVSAVAELRKSAPEVLGVACDARALPYLDCSFDLVVSQFGIEYAGVEAFDEAARLVDAGGALVALIHIANGAIHKECADNLGVIETLNKARFLALARDAFAAGFDLVAGKITAVDFQEFDQRFSPAVEAAKEVLRIKGPLAAGGLLANVYRDIGYMYTRMQNYVPDEVFAWFDGVSDELASYEGRMASMTRSALDKSDISTVADRIARLGFTVQPPDVLSLKKVGAVGAWVLIARRNP